MMCLRVFSIFSLTRFQNKNKEFGLAVRRRVESAMKFINPDLTR